MSLQLLELERVFVDSASPYLKAWLNVDDAERERAYRVEVLYDLQSEEVLDARAVRTWGNDYDKRDIKPEERLISREAEELVRTNPKCGQLLFEAAHRYYRELAQDHAAQDAWDRQF